MEYYLNHIIVLVGTLIVIGVFSFMLFNKKNSPREDYIMNPSNIDERSMKILRDLIIKENEKVINETKTLRKDVTYLINIVERIHSSLEEVASNSETTINKDISVKGNNDNFGYLLNYHQFLDKNKTIIDLNQQNKSPEEIAKLLNKSVREVEMVIRLIK